MISQHINDVLVILLFGGSGIYAAGLIWGIWRMLRHPLPESFSEWADRKEKEYIAEKAALQTQHLTDMGISKDLHKITDI